MSRVHCRRAEKPGDFSLTIRAGGKFVASAHDSLSRSPHGQCSIDFGDGIQSVIRHAQSVRPGFALGYRTSEHIRERELFETSSAQISIVWSVSIAKL